MSVKACHVPRPVNEVSGRIVVGRHSRHRTTAPSIWLDVWFGLVAPAKTPQEAIALLNQKVSLIVAEPEFRNRLLDLGGVAPTSGNTVEAFADVLQRELAVLPKAARDLGLKLD